MLSVWHACLWAESSRQLTTWVSAQRRHAPVLFSCGKHQLQGVWGRATPPTGSARGKARSQNMKARANEREGRSPLASSCQSNGARGTGPPPSSTERGPPHIDVLLWRFAEGGLTPGAAEVVGRA